LKRKKNSKNKKINAGAMTTSRAQTTEYLSKELKSLTLTPDRFENFKLFKEKIIGNFDILFEKMEQ